MKKVIIALSCCALAALSFANDLDAARNQQKWQEVFTQFQESEPGILTIEQKQKVIENLDAFFRDPDILLRVPVAVLIAYYLMQSGAADALWSENEIDANESAVLLEGIVPTGKEKLALQKINERLFALKNMEKGKDKTHPPQQGVQPAEREFVETLKLMRLAFEKETEVLEKVLKHLLFPKKPERYGP